MNKLLDVKGLSVHFPSSRGVVKAVEDLSFTVEERETLAIVGESGSGKSTAALSLLRLLNVPPVSGSVDFLGRDLAKLGLDELRRIRGKEIGVIFQDSMMALNPVHTVGRQIAEVLRLHLGMTRAETEREVVRMLGLVGVPAPEARARQYPHNLSGGMRQRVMIAMALACRPKLLIADEPTTALDVTVQAQILELIDELKSTFGMAVLLITHDLGVVAEYAHRVLVMYAGRKVENGTVRDIFYDPRHPYTRGLLSSVRWDDHSGPFLPEIPGTVPSPHELPAGCSFAPRCGSALPICQQQRPADLQVASGHEAACFLNEEVLADAGR